MQGLPALGSTHHPTPISRRSSWSAWFQSSHFDAELQGWAAGPRRRAPEAGGAPDVQAQAPDAALFVGSGKAGEIQTLAQVHGAKGGAVRPGPQAQRSDAILTPSADAGQRDRTLLHPGDLCPARPRTSKLQVEL